MSLELAELQSVAEQFGVSDEQVRRDHVISHLLALISNELADEILFFGGTALARTHLLDGRLSEDLDLIALSPRRDVAIDGDALDLYRRYGPTHRAPSPDLFKEPPSEEAWRAALAGQTRLSVTAAQALADVRKAWILLH